MDKLEKEYKKYRLLKRISFGISIACCVLPVIIAAFLTAPAMESPGKKIALGGVVTLLAGIVVLVVCRSLVRKLAAKIPYTLSVLVTVFVMLLLMIGLRRIVDDIIALLVVAVIGAVVGLVFEMISVYCESMMQEKKELYLRGKNDHG